MKERIKTTLQITAGIVLVAAYAYFDTIKPTLARREFAEKTVNEMKEAGFIIEEVPQGGTLINPITWFLSRPLNIQAHIPLSELDNRIFTWFRVVALIPSLDEGWDKLEYNHTFVQSDCVKKTFLIVDERRFNEMYKRESLNGKSGVYSVTGNAIPKDWKEIRPNHFGAVLNYFEETPIEKLGYWENQIYGPLYKRMCAKAKT